MNLRQTMIVVGLVFAIALAVVVAKQMSTEAMAVVIGVVCGVAAGIPTALLLLVAMNRRDHARLEELEDQARQAQRNYPPVVVIQGGAPQALPGGFQADYWPAPQPGPVSQRDFRVVGGDDLIVDAGRY
jgi:hypothetical protein